MAGTHCTPDHVPPARKAAHAAVSATSPDDADVCSAPMPPSPLPLGLARRSPVISLSAQTAMCAATSPVRTAATQIADYHPPPTLVGRQLPSIRQRAPLPVSVPLPRFAVPGPELTPAPAQPQPVVTQKYHSPPGSGSSTPLYDLAGVRLGELQCRPVGTRRRFCGALGCLAYCGPVYATQPSGVTGATVTQSGTFGF